MDKLYKITVLAKSEDEAKEIVLKENKITSIISVDEIIRVYDVLAVKNINGETAKRSDGGAKRN